MNAFEFLNLVKEGKKSLKNKKHFCHFLTFDLNIQDEGNWTPISHILCFNKHHQYLLSPEQIMQICERSDINLKNNDGWTFFHCILIFNKTQSLNLKNNQIISLLKKMDLTLHTTERKHPIYFILDTNETANLGFTNQQLFELYENTIHILDKGNSLAEKENFLKCMTALYPSFIHSYHVYKEKKSFLHPM